MNDNWYKKKWFHITMTRNRRYPAESQRGECYADDLVILANTPAQAELLQHIQEREPGNIGL